METLIPKIECEDVSFDLFSVFLSSYFRPGHTNAPNFLFNAASLSSGCCLCFFATCFASATSTSSSALCGRFLGCGSLILGLGLWGWGKKWGFWAWDLVYWRWLFEISDRMVGQVDLLSSGLGFRLWYFQLLGGRKLFVEIPDWEFSSREHLSWVAILVIQDFLSYRFCLPALIFSAVRRTLGVCWSFLEAGFAFKKDLEEPSWSFQLLEREVLERLLFSRKCLSWKFGGQLRARSRNLGCNGRREIWWCDGFVGCEGLVVSLLFWEVLGVLLSQ